MYFHNLLIECILFYLKLYSFIEIKILLLMEYLYDLYYSDYYKIVMFNNKQITNQYINKNLEGIDISNKQYDLLIFQDDRNCLLIDNKEEYLKFTLSYFMKKCDILNNKSDEDICVIKLCNFTFSLIVIYINDKEYEIKLKNYYYNFYVVGNKINIHFIKYFAYKYLQIKENIEDYKLIIVDNDCKYIDNLTNNNTIVFYENKYELK